jgi:hypothetical protein
VGADYSVTAADLVPSGGQGRAEFGIRLRGVTADTPRSL